MEKYLTQLIAILKEFKYSTDSRSIPCPQDFIDYIDTWVKLKVSDKLDIKSITDVRFEHLPPEQLLSDEQIKPLYIALLDFLKANGINISIPITVPVRYKYTIVRDTWDTYEIGTFSENYIETFCAGDSELCLLGDYCPCLNPNENKKEFSSAIDHFYTLDENKSYPLVDLDMPFEEEDYEEDEFEEEEELDYAKMWQTYNPIAFVKSKYIPQLAQDLKDAAFALHPKGHLHTYEEIPGVASENLIYKSIFSFLQKEAIDFPNWADLSFHEADVVSKTLMDIFDQEFFNEQLPYLDCYLRYRVLTEYLANEIAFIDIDSYLVKPLTEEELAIENEKANQFHKDLFKNIDFKIDENPDEGILGIPDEDLPF